MNTIKQDYIEKANALSLSNELNQDQKDLILSIIDKFEDNDPALHNVYQLLIKRVKLGLYLILLLQLMLWNSFIKKDKIIV
nr:hypothetical protein [Mycoplasmopsis bovis]